MKQTTNSQRPDFLKLIAFKAEKSLTFAERQAVYESAVQMQQNAQSALGKKRIQNPDIIFSLLIDK